MSPIPGSLPFKGFEVTQLVAPVVWKQVRHAPKAPYPPKGAALVLHFGNSDLAVDVHYEAYDGIPLLAKWITVNNLGSKAIRLNSFENEILSVVEAESPVDPPNAWRNPLVSV